MAPRGTVLVVDDDHDVRDTLIDLLHDRGYQAVGAADGSEALDLLRAGVGAPPVAILLDLMMPVMDGLRFRDEQLADPRIAEIPVIVMSAFGAAARPLGAAGFLAKPFDTFALLSLLQRL